MCVFCFLFFSYATGHVAWNKNNDYDDVNDDDFFSFISILVVGYLYSLLFVNVAPLSGLKTRREQPTEDGINV